MKRIFEEIIDIVLTLFILIVIYITIKGFGLWIGLCIAIVEYVAIKLAARYVVKKSGYRMLKKETQKKINDFRLSLSSDCHRCKGKGMEGGCPRCGNWPGLGPYRIVGGEEYFLITNKEKRSFYYVCQVLFKMLGKKIMFDEAKNIDGDPMPSSWIAVWGVLE